MFARAHACPASQASMHMRIADNSSASLARRISAIVVVTVLCIGLPKQSWTPQMPCCVVAVDGELPGALRRRRSRIPVGLDRFIDVGRVHRFRARRSVIKVARPPRSMSSMAGISAARLIGSK